MIFHASKKIMTFLPWYHHQFIQFQAKKQLLYNIFQIMTLSPPTAFDTQQARKLPCLRPA